MGWRVVHPGPSLESPHPCLFVPGGGGWLPHQQLHLYALCRDPYRYLFLYGAVPCWARKCLLVFQPSHRELCQADHRDPLLVCHTLALQVGRCILQVSVPPLRGWNSRPAGGVEMCRAAPEMPCALPRTEGIGKYQLAFQAKSFTSSGSWTVSF